MKSVKLTDVGDIKNELNKYRKGKKFDINQFNQVARLAWLGKLTIQPLDPMDEDTKSYLVHCDFPEPLAEKVMTFDTEGSGMDILGAIHIVDSEQGEALIRIMEEGFQERVAFYQALNERDFYFSKFYKPKDREEKAGEGGGEQG